MLYKPSLPYSTLQKKLQPLRKLTYNKFRWWRMYDDPRNPLPNKSPLLDKILNGEFEYSHYSYQAQLCEHELNQMWLDCKSDMQWFNERSSVLRARRKRLWEDFEKDENEKLKKIFKEFSKNYTASDEELMTTIERDFDGTLEELYHYLCIRFQKLHKPNRRKCKNKNI